MDAYKYNYNYTVTDGDLKVPNEALRTALKKDLDKEDNFEKNINKVFTHDKARNNEGYTFFLNKEECETINDVFEGTLLTKPQELKRLLTSIAHQAAFAYILQFEKAQGCPLTSLQSQTLEGSTECTVTLNTTTKKCCIKMVQKTPISLIVKNDGLSMIDVDPSKSHCYRSIEIVVDVRENSKMADDRFAAISIVKIQTTGKFIRKSQ